MEKMDCMGSSFVRRDRWNYAFLTLENTIGKTTNK